MQALRKKPTQLSKSLLLQLRHCQPLDHRLPKTEKSQNVTVCDKVHPLWSEISFYLYSLLSTMLHWALTKPCWKEEPSCCYQLSAHYRVGLSLSSVQQGGHLPLASCHRTDRPVRPAFESRQRHMAFVIPHKDAVCKLQLEYSHVDGLLFVRSTGRVSLDERCEKSWAHLFCLRLWTRGRREKHRDI